MKLWKSRITKMLIHSTGFKCLWNSIELIQTEVFRLIFYTSQNIVSITVLSVCTADITWFIDCTESLCIMYKFMISFYFFKIKLLGPWRQKAPYSPCIFTVPKSLSLMVLTRMILGTLGKSSWSSGDFIVMY